MYSSVIFQGKILKTAVFFYNKIFSFRANNSTLNGSTFSLFKRKKKKAKETNVKRVEIDYNAIQEERRKKAAVSKRFYTRNTNVWESGVCSFDRQRKSVSIILAEEIYCKTF